jgi:hypothetical protein
MTCTCQIVDPFHEKEGYINFGPCHSASAEMVKRLTQEQQAIKADCDQRTRDAGERMRLLEAGNENANGLIGQQADEIAHLQAAQRRLREALLKAIVLIEDEYCSHLEPHGADTTTCYAKEQHAALRAGEGKEGK